MKEQERVFLRAVLDAHEGPYHKNREAPFADEIAASLGFNSKWAMNKVDKWCDRGWWNCGVSLRSGWFEPEGFAAATAAVMEEPQEVILEETKPTMPGAYENPARAVFDIDFGTEKPLEKSP